MARKRNLQTGTDGNCPHCHGVHLLWVSGEEAVGDVRYICPRENKVVTTTWETPIAFTKTTTIPKDAIQAARI